MAKGKRCTLSSRLKPECLSSSCSASPRKQARGATLREADRYKTIWIDVIESARRSFPDPCVSQNRIMNRFVDNDVCDSVRSIHWSLGECALCGSQPCSPEPSTLFPHKCSLSVSHIPSGAQGRELRQGLRRFWRALQWSLNINKKRNSKNLRTAV